MSEVIFVFFVFFSLYFLYFLREWGAGDVEHMIMCLISSQHCEPVIQSQNLAEEDADQQTQSQVFFLYFFLCIFIFQECGEREMLNI